MSESKSKEEKVDELLNILFREGFDDWYTGDFECFVHGDDDCKTREQIREDIAEMFRHTL